MIDCFWLTILSYLTLSPQFKSKITKSLNIPLLEPNPCGFHLAVHISSFPIAKWLYERSTDDPEMRWCYFGH